MSETTATPHHPARPDEATAFWVVEPGHGELRDTILPPLAEGHLRVRALHSAVSRGTETLVWRGEVPASEFQRMRAPFQQGEFPGPVKYGYVSVGVVEQGAADWLGRNVFCLYPHQSLYDVPVGSVHALPPNVPPGRAVLAANLETAVNAVWDACPRAGDRIAVVGAGVLGLLVAWLCAGMRGCEVEVVDVSPRRRVPAEHLGARFALAADATPEADLVFHCSGHGAGLSTALSLAGFEATVLELSWYGSRRVEAPLGEAFHARRLTLRSSQVGHVATAQRARWSYKRRLSLVMTLLANGALDVLVTDAAPFRDLPSVMERLSDGAVDTLCQRIDYPAR